MIPIYSTTVLYDITGLLEGSAMKLIEGYTAKQYNSGNMNAFQQEKSLASSSTIA